MEKIKELGYKILNRIWILLRWMLLGGGCGVLIGIIAGLFGRSITIVSNFRIAHPWMLYLLPISGILIVYLYKFDKYNTNTNLVIDGIQKGSYVPLRMAPLIAISTILTHTCGGSAGREGAALQLGGSIGGTIGKYLKLEEADKKIMIMIGMSAAFSALFGTPLTATIFSIEVISVGIMQYAALVPCAFAALAAKDVAEWIGCEGEHFFIPSYIDFSFINASKIIFLAFLCAFISILFCNFLHDIEHSFHRVEDKRIRILIGSVLIILLSKVFNTTDYLGTGMSIIEKAVEGETVPLAFLLKIAFTAITLGCGFKGGEIVPSLFVGATFGCLFGQILHLSPALCAACGMVAIFCGMTNCPISSLFLSFELFGFDCMPFFLMAIGVSYLESGYFGLYNSQKIMYSKTELHFINKKANEH